MFKKIRERRIHFTILAFFTGLMLGINFSFLASANESPHKYLDYFHKVYQILKSQYVDEPNNKDVIFGAIEGMIKSLNDPYSRLLDEKSFSSLNEMTTGKFVGVGIVITIKDSDVVVISPIDDSPAQRAGILSGDVITRVNKTLIKDKKLSDIVDMIKGLPNSRVKINIKREGQDEEMEFELERTPIKIKSVEYSLIENSNAGYVKLINFGSDTAKDMADALEFFNGKNVSRVLLDLRSNPGGLLQSAIEVSGLFIEKGQIIVSTKGRAGSGEEIVHRSERNPVYTKKLIVLVNKGSASASEILAGAIRDNKRGKLLGEKTFGKGSVQKTFNLEKDIAVAVTVAKYYTPSGELIHNKGIEPDYKVPMFDIPNDELKIFKEITSEKLMDKFVHKDTVYDEKTRKSFVEFLAAQNKKMSEKTAGYMLKKRINLYKKSSLYDLEFDSQLASGLEKINKND